MNSKPRITELQVKAIRGLLSIGFKRKEIMELLHIPYSTIQRHSSDTDYELYRKRRKEAYLKKVWGENK